MHQMAKIPFESASFCPTARLVRKYLNKDIENRYIILCEDDLKTD